MTNVQRHLLIDIYSTHCFLRGPKKGTMKKPYPMDGIHHKTVKAMIDQGMIMVIEDGIHLTAKGAELAEVARKEEVAA